ncbi:hypothetical protein Kpol_1043p49 [Vanderwaltozyma polyspora DSM 70294]|uniref:C3H1-type domain-containing protein n=1 Tax=Vanderwaltozyma polyspora (strain ATCC 22028 / DSM 70294 / BCRC 21397 / CBS 2163 / NBRC 10782 / NRRL Y-8283 / UCD 57-17) TaxID=436907 RepID=A7TIR7_VANPO|nr:uncharacterized protein Kpol_1043p49 [Vanderwaltozyma polyspora DSM 70294]EDO17859.1 hypothetical protein Kpol_1043p49 [Vanderwaltozyma polyspora DSM 70294]
MSYYNRGKSSTPCKYFQQGYCNKGNNCKFAHVLNNGNGGSTANKEGKSDAEKLKNFISPNSFNYLQKSTIGDINESKDFQVKPLASSYSSEVPCALNLINGRDYSLEESRLQYYEARQNGSVPQYESQLNARLADMQKCFNHIRAHPDWAARYLQKGTKEISETGRTTNTAPFCNFPLDLNAPVSNPAFGSNPFTSGGSANTSAFGGSANNAFGKPNFGASESPFRSTMGTGSSNLGASVQSPSACAGSAFGTPSFGSKTFGSQTNQASVGGAFGKPAFGAPSSTSNAFGAGSTTSSSFGAPSFGSAPSNTTGNTSSFGGAESSAFGKPAFGASTQPFGSSSATSSAFGAPAFGSTATSFGQVEGTFGSGSAFGKPSFGSSQGTANTSPFGSLQGNENKGAASAFESSSFGTSGFGSAQNNAITQQKNQSPFGSLSVSGQSQQSTNTPAFGTAPAGQNTSSAFGAVANGGAAGFGAFSSQPSESSAFGSTAKSPFGSIQQTGQNQTPAQSAFGATTTPSNGASQPFGLSNANINSPFGNMGVKPQSPFASQSSSTISAPMAGSNLNQGAPSDDDKREPDSLLEETLAKFKSESFTLGGVPDIPPPMVLCT